MTPDEPARRPAAGGVVTLVHAACCRLQGSPVQPVWDEIRALAPDALLLLGDTVYLERDDHDEPAALAADLRERLARQLAEPHFAALRADLRRRGAPLLAVYDDHDFLGDDRCGADVAPALREAARAAFVDAWRDPADPAPPTGALWSSHAIGPVRVLMTDQRYHRRAAAASAHDADAILGAEQWAWLEGELARRDTPFLVFASPTTFHAWRGESWEAYPAAFARLRAMLARRPGALVVAGDLHANGLYDDSGVVEVVSSGIARRGRVYGVERRNYGVLRFDGERLHVSLRSDTPGHRFETELSRADWRLA